MTYKWVITVFDEGYGPISAVYDEELDKNTAITVSIRALIIGGSFQAGKGYAEGSGIVPLSGHQNIYTFFFTAPNSRARGKECPAAISFMADEQNSLNLFRDASILFHISNELAKAIRPILSESDPPGKGINKQRLKQVVHEFSLNDQLLRLKIASPISQKEKPQLGSIRYLIRNVGNLEEAVFGIITGRPIAVIGEKPEVHLAINSLQFFAPHREIVVLPWVENEENHQADIIGADPSITPQLEDFILVHLDKGIVFGGRKNSACAKLIEEIRGLKTEVAAKIIKKRVNWFLINSLAITSMGQDDEEALKKFHFMIREIDRESLFLIVALIEKTNPILATKMISQLEDPRILKGILELPTI